MSPDLRIKSLSKIDGQKALNMVKSDRLQVAFIFLCIDIYLTLNEY